MHYSGASIFGYPAALTFAQRMHILPQSAGVSKVRPLSLYLLSLVRCNTAAVTPDTVLDVIYHLWSCLKVHNRSVRLQI